MSLTLETGIDLFGCAFSTEVQVLQHQRIV